MAKRPKTTLQLRTEKKIQYLLLDMFNQSDLSLGNKKFSITVNQVDISPNLKNLKIFIDIVSLELEKKKLVIKDLNKNSIHTIKSLLAKKINLKYVPDILFVLDESIEKLFIINELIEKAALDFKK